MSTAEIVLASFRLYGSSLAVVVLLALAAHLPLIALGTIPAEPSAADALRLALLLVPFLVLTGVAVHGIYVVLLGALLDQPLAPARIALLTLRRLVISATLTYIAANVAAHLGFLFLVLPGLIVGGLTAPAVAAAIVEGRSAPGAIYRSFLLMRRDVFRGIAVFAFGVLISEFLPLLLLIGMENVAGSSPFSPLLAAVMGAITLPIALAAALLLYTSARLGEGATADALSREIQAALGIKPAPGRGQL